MRTPTVNALVDASCSVWLVAALSQHHLLNYKKRKLFLVWRLKRVHHQLKHNTYFSLPVVCG